MIVITKKDNPLLYHVCTFTSRDKLRKHMSCLRYNKNTNSLYATDGHRLIKVENALNKCPELSQDIQETYDVVKKGSTYILTESSNNSDVVLFERLEYIIPILDGKILRKTIDTSIPSWFSALTLCTKKLLNVTLVQNSINCKVLDNKFDVYSESDICTPILLLNGTEIIIVLMPMRE